MVVLQRQMQAGGPAAQALGLEASLPAHQCYYLKVTFVAHLENGTSFSQDHLKHNTGALSAALSTQNDRGGRPQEIWSHPQSGLLP